MLTGALLLVLAALSVGAEAAPDTTDDAAPSMVPSPDPTARARRSFQEDVVRFTNDARAQEGLAPLQANDSLMQAAQTYAQALAPGGCFAHDCPPTPSQKDRIAQAGYGGWKRIGENIAAGDRSAEAVVAGWLESPGHRANILKPEYTEIGVGVASGDGTYGIYWVQMFATPSQQVSQGQLAGARNSAWIQPLCRLSAWTLAHSDSASSSTVTEVPSRSPAG
jgi:uncharacterized protein YkwD